MTQYIGAKYVPSFDGAWESGKAYDSLCCVTDNYGNTWVSKKTVPADAPLEEGQYWIKAFDFNAQVEQYRQAVETAIQEVRESEQTFYDEVVQENDAFQNDINRQMSDYQTTVNNTVNQYKQDIDDSESAYKAEIDQSEAAFTNELNGKYNAQQNQIDQLVLQAGSPEPTSAEIAAARGAFATLADRLNEGMVNVNDMYYDGSGYLYNVQSSKVWLYARNEYDIVERHQSDGYFPTALTEEKWRTCNRAWCVVATRQRIPETASVKTGIIWIFSDNFSYVYTRQYVDQGTVTFSGEWTERGENDLSDLQAAVSALQSEIVNARDTYPTLDARIDAINNVFDNDLFDTVDITSSTIVNRVVVAKSITAPDSATDSNPHYRMLFYQLSSNNDATSDRYLATLYIIYTKTQGNGDTIQLIRRVGAGADTITRYYNASNDKWYTIGNDSDLSQTYNETVFGITKPYGGGLLFRGSESSFAIAYQLSASTITSDTGYLPTIPDIGVIPSADYMVLLHGVPSSSIPPAPFIVFRTPSTIDPTQNRYAIARGTFGTDTVQSSDGQRRLLFRFSQVIFKHDDFDSEHCNTILAMNFSTFPYYTYFHDIVAPPTNNRKRKSKEITENIDDELWE